MFSFDTSPLQNLLPLHHTLAKPDQKDGPTRPNFRRLIMRSNHGLKAASITNPFDDAGDKSRTVQHTHLPGQADVRIDERIIVRDHVLVGCFGGDGVLQGIGRSLKEKTPERAMDEME